MMKSRFCFSFFLLSVLLPFNCLAAPDPIRIGYLLDLSAKGSFMGLQSQAGALLAARELTKEGTPVEILFDDHRTEAKSGVTGARKLLEIDKVEALLCDLSPPCIAASPIAAEAKRPFLYQAPITSILGSNQHAFKHFLDYQEGCRRIATHWKNSGIERVAHFKVNTEFGELCLEGAREVFKEQEVFAYDSGDDLRPLVSRLLVSKPQAILQTGYEADYISRFRATTDFNIAVPSGMPQPLLTKTVQEAVGEHGLTGTIVFGFPHIAEAFVAKLKREGLHRSDVSIESAAIGYLFVRQLSAAILACPRRDLNCLTAKLAGSPREDTLGFSGWRERIASYDYVLREWRNGVFNELSRLP